MSLWGARTRLECDRPSPTFHVFEYFISLWVPHLERMVFLYAVNMCLLWLVNKEASLAYGKSGYSQAGNPKESQKEERQRQRRHQPTTQGATRCQLTDNVMRLCIAIELAKELLKLQPQVLGTEGASIESASCPRELKKSNIHGLFGELCTVSVTHIFKWILYRIAVLRDAKILLALDYFEISRDHFRGRGPKFSSQHPHGSSQPPITLDPGDLVPSSNLSRLLQNGKYYQWVVKVTFSFYTPIVLSGRNHK
ncbi:hypothetical protein STEG23_010329, partial [Scotinomys teguina]